MLRKPSPEILCTCKLTYTCNVRLSLQTLLRHPHTMVPFHDPPYCAHSPPTSELTSASLACISDSPTPPLPRCCSTPYPHHRTHK